MLKVFEYDVEALIEPFIKNRLELNVAVAGLDEPVASVTEMPVTQPGVAADVQREVQAAGAEERRVERGDGRRAARARPEDLPAEMRAARAALRDDGLRRARVRGHLADRLPDRRRHATSCTSTRSTRCPGSLAFYLWSAAPHYWTITELLSRLIDRAERLRAMKRGLQRQPPPDLTLAQLIRSVVRLGGVLRAEYRHNGPKHAAWRTARTRGTSSRVQSVLRTKNAALRTWNRSFGNGPKHPAWRTARRRGKPHLGSSRSTCGNSVSCRGFRPSDSVSRLTPTRAARKVRRRRVLRPVWLYSVGSERRTPHVERRTVRRAARMVRRRSALRPVVPVTQHEERRRRRRTDLGRARRGEPPVGGHSLCAQVFAR